jgi:hypothetical protein
MANKDDEAERQTTAELNDRELDEVTGGDSKAPPPPPPPPPPVGEIVIYKTVD